MFCIIGACIGRGNWYCSVKQFAEQLGGVIPKSTDCRIEII